MGTYTGMRFVGKLKEEYSDEVHGLFSKDEFEEEPWVVFSKKHSFAREFVKLPRNYMIPYGEMTAYNEDKFGKSTCEFLYNDDDTFTWVFQCDLKDYEDEISTFLNTIAWEIFSEFVAEVWPEDAEFPVIVQKTGRF